MKRITTLAAAVLAALVLTGGAAHADATSNINDQGRDTVTGCWVTHARLVYRNDWPRFQVGVRYREECGAFRPWRTVTYWDPPTHR